MLASAPARNPVHIELAHPDPDLGQVMNLMGTFDAYLNRPAQLRPAGALTHGAMRYVLIRARHPRQRIARCTGLLAPLASRPFTGLAGGLRRPEDHRSTVASRNSRCYDPPPAPTRQPAGSTRRSPRTAVDHHVPRCACVASRDGGTGSGIPP
jgi:hypothetical protein